MHCHSSFHPFAQDTWHTCGFSRRYRCTAGTFTLRGTECTHICSRSAGTTALWRTRVVRRYVSGLLLFGQLEGFRLCAKLLPYVLIHTRDYSWPPNPFIVIKHVWKMRKPKNPPMVWTKGSSLPPPHIFFAKHHFQPVVALLGKFMLGQVTS